MSGNLVPLLFALLCGGIFILALAALGVFLLLGLLDYLRHLLRYD